MYAIGAYIQDGCRGGCSFMIRIRHAFAASLRRASPASSSSLRADGAADFVHAPGLALHDISRRPRESGAQEQVTGSGPPGFPLARERRSKSTSKLAMV